MKLPGNQKVWVTIKDEHGRAKWVIASDPARVNYILYRVLKDKLEKEKVSKNPGDFERITGVKT